MYDILPKNDASRYCGIINGFAIFQIMTNKFMRNEITFLIILKKQIINSEFKYIIIWCWYRCNAIL